MSHDEKIFKIEKTALISILVFSILGGLIFGFINAEIKNYSGIENLKKFQPSISTTLFDVNGEVIAELFQEKRDLATFEDLPSCLVNAFLAAEDKDFYEHFGIDLLAIARAMGKNLIASVKSFKINIVQGGSTITQQLAKRLFTGGERTFARKALEAVLALQIEKKFSKDEILEMYFNQIYLGHGCHGISTASKFFFKKNVKHLSVVECSVLAALPSKPGGYSPLKNTRNAFIKNEDILARMVSEGNLTKERADEIYREFWPRYVDSIKTGFTTKTARTRTLDKAPYFTDYIRQILFSRFGRDVVYSEGLSVYTTLNLKRQKIAQKYLQEGVKKQDETSAKANEYYNTAVDRGLINSYSTLRMIFNLPGLLVQNDDETVLRKTIVDEILDSMDALTLLTDSRTCNKAIEKFRESIAGISSSLKVEGALIAIEPGSGYITSMVGGSEYNVANQYNRAVQARRQPGSAFKPFVYGAGIESGIINTATVLPDAPILDVDSQGSTWAPDNYEGDYRGMVPLTFALAASINIISIRIFDLIGPERIIDYASRMLKVPDIRFTPTPTLALGATELTPFEMANGYAIYANRGKDVIPFAVRYVTDRDGNELVNTEEEVGTIIAAKEMDKTIQVISPEVAWIMTDLMEGVINRGTANDSIRNRSNFYKRAAGKTGTTTNWTDAWFCGFTQDIAAAVWLGYDRSFMSLGKHQAGAAVAAPIWANYMREVYNGMRDPVFPQTPPGVIQQGVCAYTGLLPGPQCTKISGGWGIMNSGRVSEECDGNHLRMKSVLERYMEKEGLRTETEEE